MILIIVFFFALSPTANINIKSAILTINKKLYESMLKRHTIRTIYFSCSRILYFSAYIVMIILEHEKHSVKSLFQNSNSHSEFFKHYSLEYRNDI